jgi:hypothetical protein
LGRLSFQNALSYNAWGFNLQPFNVVRNEKYKVDYNIPGKACIFPMYILQIVKNLMGM